MKKGILAVLAVITLLGCGRGNPRNSGSETQAPGTIKSFGVSPATISSGGTTTISWDVDPTKMGNYASLYDWSVELVPSWASTVWCYPPAFNAGGTPCPAGGTYGTTTSTGTVLNGFITVFTGRCSSQSNESGEGASHSSCLYHGSITCKITPLSDPTNSTSGAWECQYPDTGRMSSISVGLVPGSAYGTNFTARIHITWISSGGAGYDYALVPNVTLN